MRLAHDLSLTRPQQRGSGPFVGPLDGYAIAPALAYSSRRLRSAYSSALEEWRRASDNAVATVSGDSAESFSVTTSSPVSAGGLLGNWVSGTDGFGRTWFNQGTLGSAGDMVQTSAAAQFRGAAAGVLDAINGRAAFQETAATQIMVTSGSFTETQLANGTSFTLAMVVVSAEATASCQVLWRVGGTTLGFTTNEIAVLDEWSDSAAYFWGGSFSAPPTGSRLSLAQALSGNARVKTYQRAGANMYMRRDGADQQTTATAGGTFAGSSPVRIGDGTRALGGGRIAELIWWPDALSTTDRNAYEANAKAWFGTP